MKAFFRRLARHTHIGLLYLHQAVKMRMEYRADFAVECLAALLQQASGLLMLAFLFENVPGLGGWRKEEVFFIYGFGLLPKALYDACSMNFYQFSDKYIVQGEMDRLLLRPLSSLFQLFMEGISFDFLADLALGVAVLSFASSRLGLDWGLQNGLLLVVLVLSSWAVLTGVFLTLTALGFWSQERVGLLPPVYNLLNFSQYPLPIFSPFVSFVLTYIIPFGFVAFYPSTAFLTRPEQALQVWCTPLAGALSLAAGACVWRLGLRHYAGAGS